MILSTGHSISKSGRLCVGFLLIIIFQWRSL
nr:MAG TPA: hypothetical protein [Bacteriophage sp.]